MNYYLINKGLYSYVGLLQYTSASMAQLSEAVLVTLPKDIHIRKMPHLPTKYKNLVIYNPDSMAQVTEEFYNRVGG